MFNTLPTTAANAFTWDKEQYAPYFEALMAVELTPEKIDSWMQDWSKIGKLIYEVYSRLYVATTIDTTDEHSKHLFTDFVENVFPALLTYNHQLNQKLLASGLQPDNFEIPLKKIRVDAELFREENLPLQAEISKLEMVYDETVGAQTIEWEGEEITLPQITPIMQGNDRQKREQAWRAAMERRLQDRDTLNELWVQLMDLRGQIAKNTDMPDFRAYQWQNMKRFDYTPADAETFQNAIEQVVVPAARRVYDRLQTQMGLDTLRPWDIGGQPHAGATPDPLGRPPLHPYDSIDQLTASLETIFTRVDPALGDYFKTMRQQNLLDLENRKGKAPGGYCIDYPLAERPFIFMNAVGVHDDVQTLLHEGGHAFHAFESLKLPYIHQQDVPMEFAEVASMAMELLASPYLSELYDDSGMARARMEHLEGMLRFWPYMAVVDAFQHWVYTNHQAASDPANCDAKWSELWDRFIVGVDYSGLEDFKANGWQQKLHIFQIPFYYIEYGLAQLGAVQVWANSLTDQAKAVQQYREALALGGTQSLPALFATAGAKFAFDAGTLSGAVALIEKTVDSLAHAAQ